jgi:ribonucleoside-diphosphate reductase beta chain
MLFEPRKNLKPNEYPDLLEFKDAIRQAYWVHEEFETEFMSDVQDFHVTMTDFERQVVTRAMLAIAQIEVNVKQFWGDIFKHIPKPEVGAVGYTFAESEVRHSDAYSHLLELLGLNEEFESITQYGAIADRIEYLEDYTAKQDNYPMTLLLFSVFIEHVSLFSQFLIMMAFNRHRNLLKGISNAVEATSKEEQIHGEFGLRLIEIMRQETPEKFGADFEAHVLRACRKAYKAEKKIVDWIYEGGDLDFLPRSQVENFLKDRFNSSLQRVGLEPEFEVDSTNPTAWFDEEILSSSHVDFFHKRPTSYSKNNRSYTAEDLF